MQHTGFDRVENLLPSILAGNTPLPHIKNPQYPTQRIWHRCEIRHPMDPHEMPSMLILS